MFALDNWVFLDSLTGLLAALEDTVFNHFAYKARPGFHQWLAALPFSGGADGCGIQEEKGSGVCIFHFALYKNISAEAEGFFFPLHPGCFNNRILGDIKPFNSEYQLLKFSDG